MIFLVPAVLFRLVFPLFLFIACAVRPCLFSAIYGFLLLVWPFIPNVNKAGISGCTKSYLIVCSLLSFAYAVLQIIFFFVFPVTNSEPTACLSSNFTSDLLKTIGFQKVQPHDFMSGLRNIGPDLATFAISTVTMIVCFMYHRGVSAIGADNVAGRSGGTYGATGTSGAAKPSTVGGGPERAAGAGNDAAAAGPSTSSSKGQRSSPTSKKRSTSPVRSYDAAGAGDGRAAQKPTAKRSQHYLILALRLSDVFFVIFLAILVSIWPCLLSVPYFVIFIILTTWWAAYAPVRRPCFNTAKIFLLIYCALHLTALYWYQIFVQVPYFKEAWNLPVNSTTFLPRLIGLTPLVNETNCGGFYPLLFESTTLSWPAFVNPILLIIFYIFGAFQYLFTKQGITIIGAKRRSYNGIEIHPDDGSSVHEELLGTEDDDEASAPVAERQQSIGGLPTTSDSYRSAVSPSSPKLSAIKKDDGDPRRNVSPSRQFSRFLSAAFSPQKGLKHGRFLASVIGFAVRHIYALTLVSMMAWAITYHAWLSFVWLLTACLIWLMPDSRKWCLWLSPIILLYAEILIGLQFVYGIRKTLIGTFNESEWRDFHQIGLDTPKDLACVPILLKMFYSIPFFITLRLFLRRRRYPDIENADQTAYGTFSVMVTEPVIAGSSFLGGLLVKYWIFVVGLVLLLISIREPVVAYGVCYMAFFVVLITVLQVSFRFWRFMLSVYLSILIAFSIAILLLVYTYQFAKVPEIWKNFTNWPDGSANDSNINIFKDLGLIKYESGSLFVTLLTPISFLIVVCLQLKFFHAGFLRITNISALLQPTNPLDAVPDSGEHPAASSGQSSYSKWLKLLKYYYDQFVDVVWRLLEIHVAKLVALALLLLAVYEVNAVNFVFVVLVCIMVPWRGLSMVVSIIACLWAACIVLTRMMFQMTFAQSKASEKLKSNQCDEFTHLGYNTSNDSAKWAGFEKTDNIGYYLKGYILVFVLLTFQAIIYLRQRYRRVCLNKMAPARGIVFPDVTRVNADESLTRCLQYLLNFCFYKFGLELTFIVLAIDIAIRLDGMALIYSLWLIFLFSLSRCVLSRVWYIFVLFMAIVIPVQYLICVGLPPSACIVYPWNRWVSGSDDSWNNLYHWLYLPNYNYIPGPSVLIGDFFVLLFACCQLYVFNIEFCGTDSATAQPNFEGGDNRPVDFDQPAANPVPNFINYTKSYLDVVKTIVFVYFQWITLTVIFIAGVSGISLFSLGYLLGAFMILWKGNDLYTEPMKTVRFRWYLLLYYNIVVIIIKVLLQAVGCVFLKEICDFPSGGKIVIQLFTLSCLRSVTSMTQANPACNVKHEEAELYYDVIVFAFVVFQLRIFSSWYFRHTIVEFNAERILSYRGAMLMNQLIKKDMKEQLEIEQKIYDRLIGKTNGIRDRYLKKLAGTEILDAKTYAPESDSRLAFSAKCCEAKTYAQAKRAGDYYMFEDESADEEFLELEAPKDSIAPEVSPHTQLRGVGPIQLAHLAVTKDFNLKETVDEAEKSDERKRSTSVSGRDELSPASKSAPSSVPPTFTIERPTSDPTAITDLDDDFESERVTDVDSSFKPKAEEAATSAATGKPADSFLLSILKFLRFAFVSVPDHCAFWFNKWSRDYRYVAHVLKKEKRLLKDNLVQRQPQGAIVNVKKVRETIFSGEFGQKIHLVKSATEINDVEKEVNDFWLQHNVFVRFIISAFYLLLSHTEILCYLMIILDQMDNASLISLPLPLLAFFWGTLCSPRPPQFFWITVITYTMAMIVIKFIAQFNFQTSAKTSVDPFEPVRILGLEKKDYYASWDVALLMVLFFHRYVLKTLGLWKVSAIDKEFGGTATQVDGVGKNAPSTSAVDKDPEVDPISPNNSTSVFDETDLAAKTGPNIIGSKPEEIKEAEEGRLANIEAAKKGRFAYCQSCITFYIRLLNPIYRYIMDLYAFMFLCDMICFLILTFGYSSFGVVAVGKGDVVSDIQSNKVPIGFVVMLISLMLLIIIDRGIYLRKNIVAKLVFQYFLVLLVHGWIFFALPGLTDRTPSRTAKFWYFIKCVYFLLSAWQIRNGYPSRIFGNLLTKKYNLLNFSLFTGFMVAPFLFELRTLIDWIWTDTCMPLFDFFTMENIYALIYRLKCMRKMEKDYPVPKGIPKGVVVKYGMGCPILLLIILLIWLPLLLFALVNAIGARLLPSQAKMTISIEGYPPLYAMDAQKTFLTHLSYNEFDDLYREFAGDKQALTFLRDYSANDTLNAIFRSSSSLNWGISTPSLEALAADLINKDINMDMIIEYEFVRAYTVKEPVKQTSKYKTPLSTEARTALHELITTHSTSKVAQVPFVYPAYIEIPPVGQIQPAKPLLYFKTETAGPLESTFSGINFSIVAASSSFQDGNNGSTVSSNVFWKIVPSNKPPEASSDDVIVKAFVDKIFPSSFDTITSGGIIGAYIVVVWAAGKLIRNLVVNQALDVIIAEMPDVDRILQLCLDIFLVREAKDFLLELDLFAKLIFLFRSPETLIRWTRPKKD